MAAQCIYLHIGLPKTGSTTIQHTLFQHRDQLLKHGISYWDFSPGHSRPLRLAFDLNVRPIQIDSNYGGPAAIREHLQDGLAKSRGKFILSAEGIGNWNRGALPGFKSFLAQHCSRIKVIAYVRDPVSLYHSTIQQVLKSGKALSETMAAELKYRVRIEPFMEDYGRENVDLRRFGSEHFINGDLMADFFSALDEPPQLAETFPAPERRNTTLSHRAAMVLDALNRVDGQPTGRPFAEKHLQPLFPGPPFRAPADWVERMLAANKEDIEWISAQLGADLMPTQVEGESPAPHPVLDDVAKLAALLKAELERRRARLHGKPKAS